VGLLFLIPGLEETLRVNGRAWITRDEEILGRMAVGAKRPVLGIGVEVDVCFILRAAGALATWPFELSGSAARRGLTGSGEANCPSALVS
jgi:hypothetical protein